MRTFILILFFLSIVSCSDNDSNLVSLTGENLAGTWYFKESIAADGTITPYPTYCGERERWVLNINGEFDYYDYTDGSCIPENLGETWYIGEDRRLIIFNYDSPYVRSLTGDEMRLEYEQGDGIRTEVLTRQ